MCDPNCGANPKCGIIAHVTNGKIVKIEPASFPNREYNRICLMGMTRLEYQYHSERILYPLLRIGRRGEGRFKRISWNEAFSIIVSELREAISKYGAKACYFRSGSGALGVLTSGSPVRFATLLGATTNKAGGIDYGVPKGLEYMYGVSADTYFRSGGHEFRDVMNSKYLILWGANLAETTIVDFHFLREAQAKGTKIVVVDINRTITASKADLWISPRPGSDGALALGMLYVILKEGLHDEKFLRSYTNCTFLVRSDSGRLLRIGEILGRAGVDDYAVWDEATGQIRPSGEAQVEGSLLWSGEVVLQDGLRLSCKTVFQLVKEMVWKFDPNETSRVTQVPVDTILEVARDYASSKPASIRIGYGVDRWYHSDYTSRAIGMLAACTGNIGKHGGGVSVVAGSIAAPVDVASFRYPKGLPVNRMTLMDFYEAAINGRPYPTRFLWLTAANLFNQSAANRGKLLSELIPKLDFIVVTEHFLTDTALQADIVLPVCSMFEKMDLNTFTYLQLQQKAVEPLGESKSDFSIFKELAERMGFEEYFSKTEEEFISEILVDASDGKEAVTVERLQKEGAILPFGFEAPFIGFKDLRFQTPSGKIEFYKEELLPFRAELPFFKEPIEATPNNPKFSLYPLNLVFSHSKMRVHSTFVNMPSVRRKEGEPFVQVNPDDARVRGVDDNELVKVHNDRGYVKLRARLDANIRRGVVVITSGWWVRQFVEGDPYSLTHDLWSPTSQNFSYFDTLVQLEKT